MLSGSSTECEHGPAASPGSAPSEALVCQTAIPWVCQTHPMVVVAQFRLRQGRQQTLGTEREAETRPAQFWPRWSPETWALKSVTGS